MYRAFVQTPGDSRAMPAKGPFYLVRHISCNTSQRIIDHLGELMHAREYSYGSSEVSGPLVICHVLCNTSLTVSVGKTNAEQYVFGQQSMNCRY